MSLFEKNNKNIRFRYRKVYIDMFVMILGILYYAKSILNE